MSQQHALIADGHHRWATYLRLRSEHFAQGAPVGKSPWNHGLVLLVDSARYPLHVQAIHRVLPQLPLERALHAVKAQEAFRVTTLQLPLARALESLDAASGNAFLLSDGGPTCHLLDSPSPGLLERTLDTSRPESWRELDAAVLHSVLLDEVWRVPDRPEEISYIHHTAGAVDKAARLGGTAVLMRPLREEVVRELAEQGVMMPRKSTSFGPKPATGLVLRVLEDEEY